MSRIGIFGGTFDPVHFGHLRSALEVRELLGLEEVRMIPGHHPPHRDTPGASAEHRLAMLQLAVAETSGLVADDRELRRDSLSYTVDTMLEFRDEFPGKKRLLFVGIDAFSGFKTWHRWQTILDLCDLVILARPGATLSDSAVTLLDERQVDSLDEARSANGNIVVRTLTQLDISSTVVRQLFATRRDASFLLPLSVRRYIDEHGLYR